MALSETSICNMALAMIGANRLNDLDTDSSVEAIQCRTHYDQTRDSLQRSHYWRFASDRESLVQDTVDPDFEYDNQFILPSDFLRLKSVYVDNGTQHDNIRYSFAIEDSRLLTNESSVDIRYIKRITDVAKFDPLFVEVLVLLLADKMIGPLTGGDNRIQDKIDRKLATTMRQVRTLDRQETNTVGRLNGSPWVESRFGSRWRYTVG